METDNAKEENKDNNEEAMVRIPDHLLYSSSQTSNKIMKENDVILLHMNNSRWQFVNLKPKKTCAVGKHKNVKLDPLLNYIPFGSLFEVDQKGVLEHVCV